MCVTSPRGEWGGESRSGIMEPDPLYGMTTERQSRPAKGSPKGSQSQPAGLKAQSNCCRLIFIGSFAAWLPRPKLRSSQSVVSPRGVRGPRGSYRRCEHTSGRINQGESGKARRDRRAARSVYGRFYSTLSGRRGVSRSVCESANSLWGQYECQGRE